MNPLDIFPNGSIDCDLYAFRPRGPVASRLAEKYHRDPETFSSGAFAFIWKDKGVAILKAHPRPAIISTAGSIFDRAKAALGFGPPTPATAPAKATTATPAASVTPPDPFAALGPLSPSERAELTRMEQHLANLPSEAARDAYVTSLAASITAAVEAAAPPMPTVKTAPTLDQQFASLTSHEDRQKFLTEHGRAILGRR